MSTALGYPTMTIGEIAYGNKFTSTINWTRSTTITGNCPTNPIFSNIGTLTVGNSINTNIAWTYNIIPWNCTYICNGWYYWSWCTNLATTYSSSTTYTIGQKFTYNGAIVTVTATGIGSSNTTYNGCNTHDIAIWQEGTDNIQVWSACNIGATIAYTGIPITDCEWWTTDCNLWIRNTIGSYFQWGRNDDVTETSTSSILAAADVLENTVWNTNFIVNSNPWGDWMSVQNDNLWWNTINTSIARQWPCQVGYHIPTWNASDITNEWGKAYTIEGDNYVTLMNTLMIPLAGFRITSTGLFYQQEDGFYWSSSPGGTYAYYMFFASGNSHIVYDSRAYGLSIRCIKN